VTRPTPPSSLHGTHGQITPGFLTRSAAAAGQFANSTPTTAGLISFAWPKLASAEISKPCPLADIQLPLRPRCLRGQRSVRHRSVEAMDAAGSTGSNETQRMKTELRASVRSSTAVSNSGT